ncbi:DUF6994 family protein [Vibrio cincinnatiensis]|uniref:DUF6994 family protein n=1 Tax=Vibrio cincinnatiensis TaxID=675 RepID=UPI001EE0FCBD|nr:hypothetical protein [Vibrio cincinnatiensis]MCG3740686.1 hypothetical protein [Vibrio cincinnatiensis]
MIDTNFNMYTDANGRDPDATSPTLRTYHRLLWSKPLPSGDPFDLLDDKPGHYLFHSSALGDFSLGSDAITHSYKNQIKKRWLTEQVPNQVQELFDIGSTIGAYIIFPNKRIDRKQTINQARGISRLIDDRFDLTLECIRRFYISEPNPLDETIKRYTSFFQLFGTFEGYVDFFLLNDLVDERGDVKFYLPFDDFQSPPEFKDVEDYLLYKNRVGLFVEARNKRIDEYTIKAAT